MIPADPAVLSSVGAATLMLLIFMLPLRGGHGQHAGAGAGALTVSQLCASLSTAEPDGAEPNGPDLERPHLSRAERALHETCHPPPDDGYVGRHRLAEPFDVDEYPAPLLLRTHVRVA